MPHRGRSLHVGMNSDGGLGFQATSGTGLAQQLAQQARDRGMYAECLMGGEATRWAVLGALAQAAADLQSGDSYLLTYTGHGSQKSDQDGDEADRNDEAWVLADSALADGPLLDDELNAALAAFAPGVLVHVLADACHTGTSLRNPTAASSGGRAGVLAFRSPMGGACRVPVRCSVAALGASEDPDTTLFGRLSSQVLLILGAWGPRSPGTWGQLHGALVQVYQSSWWTPPHFYTLAGDVDLPAMAAARAFAPNP